MQAYPCLNKVHNVAITFLDVICANTRQTVVERVSKAEMIFEGSVQKRDLSRTKSFASAAPVEITSEELWDHEKRGTALCELPRIIII